MTNLLLNIDAGAIDWARAQFALTAIYHWLFVPLTLGLAVIMGICETFFQPKYMIATKVDSIKKATMPSTAKGAPKMSPTNHE